MKFLIFNRTIRKTSKIEEKRGDVKIFVSELGKKAGCSPIPFVLYGHCAESLAGQISKFSTANCVAITSLDSLNEFIRSYDFIGMLAQSRPEFVGEAGDAIKFATSSKKLRVATFYGVWDYNVERGAKRAIEYQADGISMPGIMTDELFQYIFGVLAEVSEGAEIPTSVEEHLARLKKYTTSKSPFWSQQDFIVSPYY